MSQRNRTWRVLIAEWIFYNPGGTIGDIARGTGYRGEPHKRISEAEAIGWQITCHAGVGANTSLACKKGKTCEMCYPNGLLVPFPVYTAERIEISSPSEIESRNAGRTVPSDSSTENTGRSFREVQHSHPDLDPPTTLIPEREADSDSESIGAREEESHALSVLENLGLRSGFAARMLSGEA